MMKHACRRLTRAASLATMLLTSGPVFAQGTVGPIDLSGQWAVRNHEDFPYSMDMLPGDYMGLPLNAEARSGADAWLMSYWAMPERQCVMYTSQYIVLGPQSLQLSSDIDPIS